MSLQPAWYKLIEKCDHSAFEQFLNSPDCFLESTADVEAGLFEVFSWRWQVYEVTMLLLSVLCGNTTAMSLLLRKGASIRTRVRTYQGVRSVYEVAKEYASESPFFTYLEERETERKNSLTKLVSEGNINGVVDTNLAVRLQVLEDDHRKLQQQLSEALFRAQQGERQNAAFQKALDDTSAARRELERMLDATNKELAEKRAELDRVSSALAAAASGNNGNAGELQLLQQQLTAERGQRAAEVDQLKRQLDDERKQRDAEIDALQKKLVSESQIRKALESTVELQKKQLEENEKRQEKNKKILAEAKKRQSLRVEKTATGQGGSNEDDAAKNSNDEAGTVAPAPGATEEEKN